jgi:hypothetical protein
MRFDPDQGWYYEADGADVIQSADYGKATPFCPSIHMPRIASRITLEITAVRVERVQVITRADAIAEGCQPGETTEGDYSYELGFLDLWDSINAKRGPSWESNPWVWVVEFRRVQP